MRKGSDFPGDIMVAFIRSIARNKLEILGLFIGERSDSRFAYMA
jgi:hypothetical protein